jgi:hypothetical protein
MALKRPTEMTRSTTPNMPDTSRCGSSWAVLGRDNKPCAASDKVPAASRIVFLGEEDNIFSKKDSTKSLILWRCS